MGFLDYFNIVSNENCNKIEYNQDGFFTPDSSITLYLINHSHSFNDDDGYNEPDEETFTYEQTFSDEEAFFSIKLLSFNVLNSSVSEYTYNLNLSLDDGHGQYVAYGEVKIYYSTDENDNKYISDVLVNGVSNGPLHDKYNDCFNIYPYEYLPILCPNIPCNFPYHPYFTDILQEDE